MNNNKIYYWNNIKISCQCKKCKFIDSINKYNYLTFEQIYKLLCYNWIIDEFNHNKYKLWFLIDKFGYNPNLTKKTQQIIKWSLQQQLML